jgi:proteasome beta subunit
MALGVLDSEYKKEISREKARELAIKAIKSSIARDSASGDGIDVLITTSSGHIDETMSF